MDIKDLIGKTIKDAYKIKLEKYSDTGWLRLDFNDGSSCVIEAYYGRYDGKAIGEYPTRIDVIDSSDKEFIRINEGE